jgi:hypothetical protein
MTGSHGLVAVLHRNSERRPFCFGFIARYIMRVRELHRAIRQVARSGSACRVRSVVALVRCFTLAVRESSSLVIRNLVSSPGGPSASRLSLCPSGRPPTMAGQTTGCLSARTVYHERMSLYSNIPPPGWKPGDSFSMMLICADVNSDASSRIGEGTLPNRARAQAHSMPARAPCRRSHQTAPSAPVAGL